MADEMNVIPVSRTAVYKSIRKLTINFGRESSQATLKRLRPDSQNTNNNNDHNTVDTTHPFRAAVDGREIRQVLLWMSLNCLYTCLFTDCYDDPDIQKHTRSWTLRH
ncbi:hypothetical protein Q7C36_008142 [Tachysurus vachellii]|uniref:Uncharacterized protein n=1 Tax=Tachysurus vachellii TaxID=175792 RepID=A0AA88N9Y9_TACVA|nr:hypothetical protein Q7C36_008142 [Tachysurus vachellii]